MTTPVTTEQATKINEAGVRSPEDRQTGVVSEGGSGREKGEEGADCGDGNRGVCG
ncbi:unnamed protein product [Brassica rapa]|uniref:Uncharacterized protein n=2 Tax=Brassica TaxID=3705 RepID=A0A8D9M074_BRACM|nr:unnamed protein product [Brassica napus]CAG7892977.1 unnamed protein product [Brassica rapa]